MLSIGTFSKISKVTTKTLRYYDEIGLIKPVYINEENGYRYYNIEQLKTILLINRLKLYNFSLEEILTLLNNPYNENELSLLIKKKQNDIQKNINHYKYVIKQMSQDILNLEKGIHIMSYLDNIQVKLIETETKNICFVRDKINIKDYTKHMESLIEKIKKENLTVQGEPMTIFHEYDEGFNPENSDIELAVPVKENIKGTRKLEGCLCAMATLKGPYTELVSIYARLKQFIEKEKYNVILAPYEIYITDPAQTAPENNITEIYVPVTK